MINLKFFYVFQMTEAEIDENGLGPTYRLLANSVQVSEPVGAWSAQNEHDAIRIAAANRPEGHHYAATAADALVVDRYPELAPFVGEAT